MSGSSSSVDRGTYSNTYPLKFFSGIKYSLKIDYLQYSMPVPPDEALFSEQIPAVNLYKLGFKAENGTRYYTGNPNSERWLCIMSGEAMDNLRETIEEKEHVELLLSDGCNVSRIDIAMDIMRDGGDGVFVDVDTIISWFRSGKIISKHVDYGGKFISGIDDGIHAETFYIGDLEKRAKRGIFRAYDKGVELDISRYMHTRLEVEEKRRGAMRTARQIVNNDMVSVFRSKFDVLNPLWESLFDVEPIKPVRGKAIEKDEHVENQKRWKWLCEQVAPALGKAIALDACNATKDNFDLFNEIVEKHYRKNLCE